jgi:DNA-binding MurR/RpiR family transcriptional regulator
MGYEDRIRQERPKMSKSFAKLADFLLDSYVEASFMTASELAQALNLDAATVVRFSQQLGYGGYPKLQREIREKVKNDLLIRPLQAQETESIPGIVAETMRELVRAIEQVRITLDTDQMNQLVEAIGQSRRIIILAESPAQPAAYNLVYFLEQGGFSVYTARAGVTDLARTVHTATAQDVLISIDISGQSAYIARALQAAHTKGITTAAIVGAGSIPSARAAGIVLEAPAHPSLGVGIVAVEAIIYALTQSLHWRFADRFAGAEQSIDDISEKILRSSP